MKINIRPRERMDWDGKTIYQGEAKGSMMNSFDLFLLAVIGGGTACFLWYTWGYKLLIGIFHWWMPEFMSWVGL